MFEKPTFKIFSKVINAYSKVLKAKWQALL